MSWQDDATAWINFLARKREDHEERIKALEEKVAAAAQGDVAQLSSAREKLEQSIKTQGGATT